jgi:mono/diheme cytochrome c family protein
MKRGTVPAVWILAAAAGVSAVWAANPDAAERGRKALTTRAFNPPTMSLDAYENVWKQWGLAEKPVADDYDRLFRERYGLHPAPFANGRYPMGLRAAEFPLGLGKGLANDCMICHGGSIFGQSYVGLGNTALDLHAFFQEMAVADGRKFGDKVSFCNARGTNEAAAAAVYLLGLREPDLSLRLTPLDLGLRDDLCEDTPAWWLLKKKRTMYHTGSTDARSVRSLMQFMMSPLNPAATFAKEEATFKDVQAYFLSIEPPRYPLPIDAKRAAEGKVVFEKTCSRCHGTYGEKWTYPNKIVPIKEIGTDPTRYEGLSRKFDEYYNKSWFAHESGGGYPIQETAGYQAPPLDGIWATAPYFHNGSVPTVHDVLNSKARPKIFTRSFRTDREAYDEKGLGWKVQVLDAAPERGKVPMIEYRKVYDTTKPGRGNGGHTYGDNLTEEERLAVIEYLKTL